MIRLGRAGAGAALAAGLVLAGFIALDGLFPLPSLAAPATTLVVAADGQPLRAFADAKGVWRYAISLDEVSPRYLEALLAYEDRWFYDHPGVNPVALARAGAQWLRHGRIVSGGSTLTMQVARIVDPHERSPGGKARQIFRALQLEWHHSKREILAVYLNRAPFGGPVEGVQAASFFYLGKPARELTHAEAALLAVLPQSPSRLRPDRSRAQAEAARDKVLDRMVTLGAWPAEVVADAKRERVDARFVTQRTLAPLAAERLRRAAPRAAVIRTTLDTNLQTLVERRLAQEVAQLPPRTSLAVLVVDNRTLKVCAYAGSADFADAERFAHVDMVSAVRSPGSTLKPFLYALALDDGLVHSESLLVDAPTSFDGYQPGNFHQDFEGPVSVSAALSKSLNVPAVDVLDRVGAERFVAVLQGGGLRLTLPGDGRPSLAVILGGAGTTLEALVGAYTAFARGGLAGVPRFREEEPLVERRMMSAGAAWIVRDILESASRPDRPGEESTARGHRPIAWKTGTSYGFRDAWAIGVTDGYTLGVWVGRPDGTPVPGHFGANTAAPILLGLADSLPADPDGSRPARPESVRQVRVCWPLGQPAFAIDAGLCHRTRTAWALDDAVPPTLPDRIDPGASLRTAIWVDPKTGLRVSPECGAPGATRREVARWPALLEPWLDADLRRKSRLPAWHPRCARRVVASGPSLKIAGLQDGAMLHRAGGQQARPRVTLTAVGPESGVYWLVNGTMVRRTRPGAPFEYTFAEPGPYEVTGVDDSGRYDRVSVTVLD